jgi:hypothetical protein
MIELCTNPAALEGVAKIVAAAVVPICFAWVLVTMLKN